MGIKSLLVSRLSRIREIHGNEFEQGILRLAIGSIVFFYVGHEFILSPKGFLANLHQDDYAFFVSLSYLTASILLFFSVFIKKYKQTFWRVLALFTDLLHLSAGIVVSPAVVLPLFSIYLWVIVGYGFRYGSRYLLVASFLAIVLFAAAWIFGHQTVGQTSFTIGIGIALLVIPGYVYILLKRIEHSNEILLIEKKKSDVANEEKSNFLANMSHELRTPLNGIIASSELLDKTPLNEDQRELTSSVLVSANLLLDHINNILDYSKIEANEITINKQPFGIDSLLNRVSTLLKPIAQEKNLPLYINNLCPSFDYAISDKDRIAQILVNLGNNAIKFTETGHVSINSYIKHLNTNDKAALLVFDVIDTGMGIPQDKLNVIFDRFKQADNSITRKHGGTGLGLAICKELADKLDANLTVSSDTGSGSRFTLEIKCPIIQYPSITDIDCDVIICSNNKRHIADWETHINQWSKSTFAVHETKHLRSILNNLNDPERKLTVIIDETSVNASEIGQIDLSKHTHINFIGVCYDKAAHSGFRGYSAVLELPLDNRHFYHAIHGHEISKHSNDNISQISSYIAETRSGNQALNILVADDQATNQLILRKSLEIEGHTVKIVDNGHAALDELQTGEYDVALIDLHMPEMSGIEVIELYQYVENENPVPIIVISADVRDEVMQRLTPIVSGYLSKPIVIDKLYTAIHNAVRPGKHKPLKSRDKDDVAENGHDQLPFVDINSFEHTAKANIFEPGFIKELVELFVRDANALYDEIRLAVFDNNCIKYYDKVHALKGIAGNIYASKLFAVCKEAQQIANHNDFIPQARKILPQMRACISNTESALKNYLENRRSSDN